MSRTTIALAAALTVALVLAAPGGARAADPLQPGDYHRTSVGSCTLSFVYDGQGTRAGRV